MCGVADTAIYAEKPGGSRKGGDDGGGWSAGASGGTAEEEGEGSTGAGVGGGGNGEDGEGSGEAEMVAVECPDGDNHDQELTNEGVVECDSTDVNSATDQSGPVPGGPSEAENVSPSEAENVDKNPKVVSAQENMEEAVSSTQGAGASSDVDRTHSQQTVSVEETS